MARQLTEYIIILKHKNNIVPVIQELEAWGIVIDEVYKNVFPGIKARLGTLLSNWLKDDLRIDHIEQVTDIILFNVQQIPLLPTVSPWHLDRIDQRTLPLSGNYTYKTTGTNIIAYVIDSGAEFDHIEFNGRIRSVDKIGSPGVSFDPFIDQRLITNPENSNILNATRGFDEIGHGTHVAGIIGSTTYGVAKNVSLKTAKVFGASGLTSSNIIISAIDAIIEDYNINGNQPSIVNLSLGGIAPTSSTIVSNTSSPTFISGETIFIDNVMVQLIGSTILDIITSINNANIPHVKATNNLSKIKITKKPGLMTFREGSGNALLNIGFLPGVPQSSMTILERAISSLVNNGITVVVAAGNQGIDANKVSPARMPQVITVGATDRDDSVANFSNFSNNENSILPKTVNPNLLDFSRATNSNGGSAVDLFAPGVGILSTWINTVSRGIKTRNRVNILSGTSMASPIVCGLAVLSQSLTNTFTPADIKRRITSDATTGTITNLPTLSNNLLSFLKTNDNIITWNTPAGSVGSFNEGFNVSVILNASTTNNSIISYSLESGILPVGIIINSITGELHGIPDFVNANTTYTFTIRATAGILLIDRIFTIEILDALRPLTWVTPTNLGSFEEGRNLNFQFSAISQNNITSSNITYTALNSLPNNWILSSSGVFTGLAPMVLNTDLSISFTVIADDTLIQTNKLFNIKILHRQDYNSPMQPVWQTKEGIIGNAITGTPFSFTIKAIDGNHAPLTMTYHLQLTTIDGSTFGPYGHLPPGLLLNKTTGEIYGIMSPIVQDTTFIFGIWATDGANIIGGQFIIKGIKKAINIPPEWVTPAGSLGIVSSNQTINYQVEGIDIDGTVPSLLTYQIISGDIPPGLIFSTVISGTNLIGDISGTISDINATRTFAFTIRLSDGIANIDRTFSLLVKKVNQQPVWVTAPGLLGEFNEQDHIHISLSATDTHNDILTYSVVIGSLPLGITMTNKGIISGILPNVMNTTQYNFTVRVDDNISNLPGSQLFSDQEFIITIRNVIISPNIPPSWITSAGSLTNAIDGVTYSSTLVAIDPDNTSPNINYTIISGILPPGLILDITGQINGIATFSHNSLSNIYNFVVAAFDGIISIPRSFKIQVVTAASINTPVWLTNGLITTANENSFINVDLQATHTVKYQIISGNLPGGLTLISTSGNINGIANPVFANMLFTFVARATNIDGIYTDQQHSISILNIPNQAPIWNTPIGSLGIFNELTNIMIQLNAIDPDNGPISLRYTVVSGSLPSGIILDEFTGIISGNALPVNINKTSFFSINVNDGISSSIRAFSIEILKIQQFTGVTTALYVPLSGYIKRALVELNNNKLIPNTSLYLPNNSLFGRSNNMQILVANNLHVSNPNEIQVAFKKHHRLFKDLLGVPTFAVVRDTSGKILYEVIYIPIIDIQRNSYFKIASDPTRLESVSYNFNNLRIELLNDVNPTLSKASPPETNNVMIGFNNSEQLPAWMLSEQKHNDPTSILGYVPAIELAFVKTGEATTILSRINRIQTRTLQKVLQRTSFDAHSVSGNIINPSVLIGDSILINESILVTFTGNDISTIINDINSALQTNNITNIIVGVIISDIYMPNPVANALPSLIKNTGEVIHFSMEAFFISFKNITGTPLTSLGLKIGENKPTTFDGKITTFDNTITANNPSILQLGIGLRYSGIEVTFDRYVAKTSTNIQTQLKWFPDSNIPYWDSSLLQRNQFVNPYFITPAGRLPDLSINTISTLSIEASSSLIGEVITYNVTFGDLPVGLVLNPTTGNIEGLVSFSTEIVYFIVRATDTNNNFSERQFQIKIVLTSTVFNQANTTFDISPLPQTTFDSF